MAPEVDQLLELQAGVISRRQHYSKQVQWNLSPPRVRFEHAVIDVAAAAVDDPAAVAALAQAVSSRRTTAERLLAALAERHRVKRREWLTGVLRDVEAGTCSVLEHGYLTKIERPHHLPCGQRQRAEAGRTGRI